MYEVVCITDDNREYTIAVEINEAVAQIKAEEYELEHPYHYAVVRQLAN